MWVSEAGGSNDPASDVDLGSGREDEVWKDACSGCEMLVDVDRCVWLMIDIDGVVRADAGCREGVSRSRCVVWVVVDRGLAILRVAACSSFPTWWQHIEGVASARDRPHWGSVRRATYAEVTHQ